MEKILNKNNFLVLLWIFFYFFIFAILLKGSFEYLDPDLGWHLKVGEEIARTGNVPSVNLYNYTYTGTWVDHEWATNYLVYEVYSHWGYIALSLLFALLIVAVLGLLNYWATRISPGVSPVLMMVVQFFGVYASLPHFGVRMQELGLLFLVIILMFLYHYNKHRSWKMLLALIPVIYLWTCLHGSFLIGFALLLAWAGIKIFEKFLFRYYNKDWIDFSNLIKWWEIFIFIGVVLAAAVSTLFTPYGLKLYSFMAGYRSSFYQAHLQEWLPQFFFPFQYWQLLYLALIFVALILYIYYCKNKERLWRLDLWTIFVVALFIVLGFKAHRHFPLMFVATFGFVVATLSTLLKSPVSAVNNQKKWHEKLWLKLLLLGCLLLMGLAQLLTVNFTSNPFLSFQRSYPVGAIEFLRAKPQYDSLRIFNDYGWGGYLIWNYPERQLFIDGRLPQVEFAGQTFLQEYFDFFNRDKNIEKKLNDYNIDLVMMFKKDFPMKAKKWEQIFFGLSNKDLIAHNYLRDYLSNSNEWEIIYYDQTAVIYKRIN